MSSLNTIIHSLNTEEKRRFLKFLDRKNKRADVKNIKLFQLLAEGEENSVLLTKKLYGNPKKTNAYHALRKRLYSSLVDFMASSSLEDDNSTEMQIIKLILTSRGLLMSENYAAAFKILDKAETLADSEQLFPFLNEIYHTKIQFAHTLPQIDLEQLIEQFQRNQYQLNLEDRLNIVYAKMRQALVSLTYKAEVINFNELLEEVLKTYDIDLNTDLSFKSLYQLMAIVSISAFVTNDYLGIEEFILENYNRIKEKPETDKHLFYHLEVIYIIANTLFRNKKFEASLQYLKIMDELMERKLAKYKSRFILKYKLIKALNLNYLGYQTNAIECLLPHKINTHPDIESLLDIYLSLVTFFFQKQDFQEAMHIFSNFYHTDKWYTERAGKEWVIKKNLIEILLHIELENIDLVESRLQSFRRSNSNYLKGIKQERVLIFLNLVETYFKNPEVVKEESFHLKVEDSFEWLPPEREDIFVMSFYSWLKSKMENRPLFEVTLELINAARDVKDR